MMHAIKLIGKVFLSTPIVCSTTITTTPTLLDCQQSQVSIYYQIFQPWLRWMAAVSKHL